MLGSNPSADSVASTHRKGECFRIPFSLAGRAPIGRGIKAPNPGGAGAKPLRHSLLPLRKPASSHNACMMCCGHSIIIAVGFVNTSRLHNYLSVMHERFSDSSPIGLLERVSNRLNELQRSRYAAITLLLPNSQYSPVTREVHHRDRI